MRSQFLMMRRVFWLLLLAAAVLVVEGGARPAAATVAGGVNPLYLPIITTPRAFEVIPTTAVFNNVTDIANAGDERLFVTELNGIVRIRHANDTTSVFLDIRDRVSIAGSEHGLFSIVFDPEYAQNGYFYMMYTAPQPEPQKSSYLRLSRFQVTANPNVADPGSEMILLQILEDFEFHNGGALAFNPLDGYLYAGVGDDGGSMSAQVPNSLKGKLLRIGLNNTAVINGDMVQIASDTIASPAISIDRWALGLRNPWRIAIDEVHGRTFIGDVGDLTWEEINLVPIGVRGLNFGWPCREGPKVLFTGGVCDLNFVEPLHYYGAGNSCSVIAGEYYRYQNDPTLPGAMIFSDGCTREIQAMVPSPNGWSVKDIGDLSSAPPGFLTTMGKDIHGTVFVGILGDNVPLFELYIPPQ